MSKKVPAKPKRELTKKQISRWEKQKRRQRLLFRLGVFIIVAALGVVGAGWYRAEYKPYHETIVKVNGSSFNMQYFIDTLGYYGSGQSMQYLYSLASGVSKVIEQNELVVQGAAELGIVVDADEVETAIKERELPENDAYRGMVGAELTATRVQEEYLAPQIPAYDVHCQIFAMFLESERQVNEVRDRIESGDDFQLIAEELSLDMITQAQKGDLGLRPKGVLDAVLQTPVPGDYAFSAVVGELSAPLYDDGLSKGVGYWLVNVMETNLETEEANVQLMLLSNEDEALSVKAQLEAGDNFTALAMELSQHEASKENGGNLGWLTRGSLPEVIDKYVYDLETRLDAISEPIRDETVETLGGYWLVKVVDIQENMEVDGENRDVLKAIALEEWVDSLWDNPDNEIEVFLDGEKTQFAIDQLLESSSN